MASILMWLLTGVFPTPFIPSEATMNEELDSALKTTYKTGKVFETVAERRKFTMDGRYQDVIIHENGEREELPWEHNIIVNSAGNLIAALMASDTTYGIGLTWWAIGSGNPSWDITPAVPSPTDTILVNEIYRKAIPTPIGYINPDGSPSAVVTNMLQIVLTFGTSEANGTWREFGLFGGNASVTTNSGIMLNHRINGAIVKTSAISIQRTLQLTF